MRAAASLLRRGASALCFTGLIAAGAVVFAQTPSDPAPAAEAERATEAVGGPNLDLRPRRRPESFGAGATTAQHPASGAKARAAAADAALGEWDCRIWYGRKVSGYGRRLTMILEADGSWLLQGRGRDAGPFLVLGKWFRAPKGQIYGSGRETRVWDKHLGGLFALELVERDGRLVSEEDPRADCRRP